MKNLTILFSLVALTGCSGKLYTILNPVIHDDGEPQKIEGVFAYPQLNVIEVYKTTVLVDKEKNIIGNEANGCQPEFSYKYSTRVDYNRPYIMKYESGAWETNKFSVSLANGVLTNVNSESTPSNPLGKLTDYLPYKFPTKDAELEFAKSDKNKLKLCNAQKVVVGVYKHASIDDSPL